MESLETSENVIFRDPWRISGVFLGMLRDFPATFRISSLMEESPA